MKDHEPLVSVIVVTYNSSFYVTQTLESAFNQSYKNLELIVTDDCSGDNTIRIAEDWISKFKTRFARVEILPSAQNRGIPSNINKGVKAARGEWIKVIAGDDILLENCISDNLAFVTRQNCTFVYSDLIWFLNDGTEIEHDRSEDRFRSAFNKLDSEGQLKYYCRYPVFLNSATWFYSKSILNGFYDEYFKLLEDQPFIFLFLQAGNRVCYMNTNTVKYRRHSNSVVISSPVSFLKEFKESFKKYRISCLSRKSPVDLFYIFRFHIFMTEHHASRSLITKILFFPVKKVVLLLSRLIKPEAGLTVYEI